MPHHVRAPDTGAALQSLHAMAHISWFDTDLNPSCRTIVLWNCLSPLMSGSCKHNLLMGPRSMLTGRR